MPALHVRNVDDAVIARIKERAARNHRSLEGELRKILEDAARDERPHTADRLRLALKVVHVGNPGTFSRDEIYDDDGR